MTPPWDRHLIGEPSLAELLDDPVTAILMERDGVARAHLEALIGTVQARLVDAALPPDGYAGSSSVSQ